MFSVGVCHLQIPPFPHLSSLTSGLHYHRYWSNPLFARFSGFNDGDTCTTAKAEKVRLACIDTLAFYCWWQHFFRTIFRQFEDHGSRTIRWHSLNHHGSLWTSHCRAFFYYRNEGKSRVSMGHRRALFETRFSVLLCCLFLLIQAS